MKSFKSLNSISKDPYINLAAGIVASAILAADYSFFNEKWGEFLMDACGFHFDGEKIIDYAIREGVVKNGHWWV